MLQEIEYIRIEESIRMIGGFSRVLHSNEEVKNEVMANNCHAGNCSTTSCKKHTSLPNNLPSANNCKTNCVSGCGKKH